MKNCDWCGKSYEHGDGKYCSKKCRKEAGENDSGSYNTSIKDEDWSGCGEQLKSWFYILLIISAIVLYNLFF